MNLQQKNPELHEFITRWQAKYQKSYDLTSISDQADFFEGIVEMGRYMASSSTAGHMDLNVNLDGPASLRIDVTPNAS